MNLDRDFSEFIALCVAHEVRFLVVGGYALAMHGHPRFTKVLDVWVWVDGANADRMIAALGEFGFGSVGLTRDDFLTERVPVPFIGVDDLIANKRASGRSQDLADVAAQSTR